MNILIIDAQGGGMGRQLVTSVKKEFPQVEVTAVGTNALASSNMLKAGADHAATAALPDRGECSDCWMQKGGFDYRSHWDCYCGLYVW